MAVTATVALAGEIGLFFVMLVDRRRDPAVIWKRGP